MSWRKLIHFCLKDSIGFLLAKWSFPGSFVNLEIRLTRYMMQTLIEVWLEAKFTGQITVWQEKSVT